MFPSLLAVRLTVLTFTLAGAPARAPSPAEQQAFTEGLRLFEGGDAAGAERAWKAGYDLGHDPAFLVRIGEAEEKRAAAAEAVESYQRYLRESPDAADRADIEARLARLAPSGPPKPGPQTGMETETPGQMGAAPPPGQIPEASPAAPAGAPPPGASQRRDEEAAALEASIEEDQERTTIGTAAWVGTGVTALLLGTAIFFAASASGNAGDANRLLIYADPDTLVPQEYAHVAAQYEEDVRLGRRNDRLAKGFAIAAAATAVGSAILFLVDPGVERKPGTGKRASLPAPVPVAHAGGAGVGLSWVF